MDTIEKKSKILKRKLKGNVSLDTLIPYAESLGYSVVFFGTVEGDEILTAYGIDAKNTKAFSFCGTTKIIFIDNSIPTNDKLYALLHEIGHITLGHIGTGKTDILSKRICENEAETFAYMALHRKSNTLILFFLAAICALCLCFVSVQENQNNIVYVTSSGECFHRGNCTFSKDKKNCIAVEKKEAKKLYLPCKLCNP